MNFGVRRFLGGGGTPTPPITPPPQSATIQPLVIPSSAKPNWPPNSESPDQSRPNSPYESPRASTTPGLLIRKDKQKPVPPLADDEANGASIQHGRVASLALSPTQSQGSYSPSARHPSFPSLNSPIAGPSSPRIMRKAVNSSSHSSSEWKRASGLLNTKDELLMSLLSSEAMVDSRGSEILSAEEVEELKKEQQVLASRLGAMSKKLTLEIKIRDAAASLSKVNASHKKVSKQSEEQLQAANRRVDTTQKELWRVSERANEVQKKLLEHRAGVLSFSVRSLERKLTPNNGGSTEGSGYSTPNRNMPLSPTSSSTSISVSSKPRFDGAHLFAGHADTVVPSTPRPPADATALEEKLKEVTEALKLANQKQGELARELSHVRLEKSEVETTMGMELQSAEETITALEKELPRLESLDSQLQDLLEDKNVWERDKAENERQIETLERRLEILEERSGEATEMEGILAETKRNNQLELQRKDQEIQELQVQLEASHAEGGKALAVGSHVDEALASLRVMMQRHSVYSSDPSLQGSILALRSHLETISAKINYHSQAQEEWESLRRKLEEDVRNGLDKREALFRDVEDARREREDARREAKAMEALLLKSQTDSPATRIFLPAPTGDAGKIIAALQPIWAVLPSPEARAAKLGGGPRILRAGSPTNSPGSPRPQLASLSEMDVRSLKTLYDNRMPSLPNTSAFTVEAFASRVQALIADDRALIERLIRFAQAHDLLKRNAERAQKLAQESNNALETYQKQVRTLEDRNISLASKVTALQDEVQHLQDTVERIQAEKREVEMHAAEQAETCHQLTEANNTLSARTLTLAEEAASAPEMVKRQLEAQLSECKASLSRAQDEIDAMRMSEQSQRIALLDELNSMQTENGNLRAQLRAIKK